MPEVTVGGGGAIRLPVELSSKIGLQMLLTGRPMTAQEALHYGLINQIAQPDDVIAPTMALARDIAAAAPIAVAATLRVARASMGLRDEANAWCVNDDVMAEVFATDDARDGMLAFAQRCARTWINRWRAAVPDCPRSQSNYRIRCASRKL